MGELLISNCRYACHTPPESRMRNGSLSDDLTTHFPDENQSEPRNDTGDSEYDDYGDIEMEREDTVRKCFQINT